MAIRELSADTAGWANYFVRSQSNRMPHVHRTLARKFQGKPYEVENVEFHDCPDSGERVYDRDAMRKIEAQSPAFRKRRN